MIVILIASFKTDLALETSVGFFVFIKKHSDTFFLFFIKNTEGAFFYILNEFTPIE